jgi:hypothetical protein
VAGNAITIIYSSQNQPSQDIEFLAWDYINVKKQQWPPILQITYAK